MPDEADQPEPPSPLEPGCDTKAANPYTKTELLAALRASENRLYGSEIVDQVKQLPLEDRQKFVAARLHLTAVIAHLNASLMRDIREKLEAQSAELRLGIGDLEASLGRLEKAVAWAGAINRVIEGIGRVIPLL